MHYSATQLVALLVAAYMVQSGTPTLGLCLDECGLRCVGRPKVGAEQNDVILTLTLTLSDLLLERLPYKGLCRNPPFAVCAGMPRANALCVRGKRMAHHRISRYHLGSRGLFFIDWRCIQGPLQRKQLCSG